MDRNLKARIDAIIAAQGADVKEESVSMGSKSDGTYRDLGEFMFRRLSSLELDKLRLGSIGKDGAFNPAKHAGSNARFLAATLCDEHGNPLYANEEIEKWPGYVVDAYLAAANKANSLDKASQENAAKNSKPTPDAN